jgi:phosphatidate cytidylyltransferase
VTGNLLESPHPVFTIYSLTILGVLLFAGAVLLVLDRVLHKNVASIWRTYRGWLIMIPAILGALWLGREATIIGIALVSIFGFKEFARATGLYTDFWYTIVVYTGIVGLATLMLVGDPNTGAAGWYGMFMAAPVYVIALLFTIPVLRNRTQGQLQRVSLSIVGFVYLGWMLGHLGFLTNSTHFYGYLLFLVFAVEINDVAAFTFGKLFGKHKLRSEVSPNKTIEGSLGALATSLALPWLLAFSFPHFGWAELLLTGLIVGVGGQLGDLTVSFIKRDVGIKDMGVMIPGHGGILDRVDSLIFVAPLFFHMVRWFHGL